MRACAHTPASCPESNRKHVARKQIYDTKSSRLTLYPSLRCFLKMCVKIFAGSKSKTGTMQLFVNVVLEATIYEKCCKAVQIRFDSNPPLIQIRDRNPEHAKSSMFRSNLKYFPAANLKEIFRLGYGVTTGSRNALMHSNFATVSWSGVGVRRCFC